MKHNKIRIAIIGVGNCASSLIQGIQFYKYAKPDTSVPGLMNVTLGGYHVHDVECVLGIDVAANKVGRDVSEAIFEFPNNTVKFSDVPKLGAPVVRGVTLDGIGYYIKENQMYEESTLPPADLEKLIKELDVDVLVNYLPVGSEEATRYYADLALKTGCAFLNCMPVFIASNPVWAQKFADAKLPLIGDDMKSQVGATITHRVLAQMFADRGVKIKNTYQLNFGGNTDFMNMLERSRLVSKKISKTGAVTSAIGYPMPEESVHVGPSDYVPFLKDQKFCHIRIEAEAFGGVPLLCEVKLEVHDSPNSAGVVIDAVRVAKIALDRGVGGIIPHASAYFFKTPPVQIRDEVALQQMHAFVDAIA
jgi:myo-inositol-1-phosphate synthase